MSASSGSRSRRRSAGNVTANGRPAMRSRISRIFPSLRVATKSFKGSRVPAPQAGEQVAGGVSRLERHPDDASPAALHFPGTDDLLARVVSPLHEHVGPQQLDEPKGGVLVEQHHSVDAREGGDEPGPRSEEHTSELQSQSNLVCRLLLEKKKKKQENKDK